MATAPLRAVCSKRDRADPMRRMLTLPRSSDQGEQALGRGSRGAPARAPIDHCHPCLARFLEPNLTSKRKDLRESRPGAGADEGRTRGAMALRDAPMAQV